MMNFTLMALQWPTQRAGDYALQKEFYSGKQKRHTFKALVLSSAFREILVYRCTKPGKNHDYALFKELNPQILFDCC